MIFDNISNIKSYENLGERWKKAFAFLKQYKGGDNGKIVIDGENLFAIVQNAENTRKKRTFLTILYLTGRGK